MLHITNGHSAAIRQGGIPSEVSYWLDVLHEGPVPEGLTFDEMSGVRAQFLMNSGWGDDCVRSDFALRDAQLASWAGHEEVVLWFEHDLYDQLQLIQILDWFASRDLGGTGLRLICIGEFPGIARFGGLGELRPDQLLTLFPGRREISKAALELASSAWAAFRSQDPSRIEELLAVDTSALPYLQGALERHIEQFPSVKNGLSRSERQILEIVSKSSCSFAEVFVQDTDREERIFAGDLVLWSYIQRMRDGKVPLVEGTRQQIAITSAGENVLPGRADAIELNGIDRWLGGVHLEGPDAAWRWDESRRKLARKDVSRAHRH
jgi:hypothetical protein